MVVGVLQFELLIPWAQSLKDKRTVVRSVKDRLHRQHLVSVAEVSHQDALNVAVLGVAIVSESGSHAASVLDRIEAKLRGLPDAELGDTTREILSGRTGPMAPPAEPKPLADGTLERELLELLDDDELERLRAGIDAGDRGR